MDLGGQITEGGAGETCRSWRGVGVRLGREIGTGCWWRILKETDHMGDLGSCKNGGNNPETGLLTRGLAQ